jgi:hypothetical protein
MTTRSCIIALFIAHAFGCSDTATIGGLCVFDCGIADGGSTGHSDCGAPGCDGSVDAGTDGDDGGVVCSAGSFELTPMRTDLMLVVDNSASFAPWWPALDEGLLSFIRETPAEGLGVGLQRFDEVCDSAPYANPLIPIAPLADNRAALLQMLPFEGVASTSTIPALDGVLQYARGWAAANSDVRVAVVLLTDASPGACDGLAGDFDGEAKRIARAGVEGTPSIKTYVIGFSTLLTLEGLATAGGTEPLPISVTPAVGEVRAALDKVRQDAQTCAFRWQTGWTLAADSAVVVKAPDGSERRVPIVANRAACASDDGFYVDDPKAPYPLLACANTCVSLTAAARPALSTACTSPGRN